MNRYIIDTHCHLDFENLAEDLDSLLHRARAAGVKRFISISVRVKKFKQILEIAEKYEDVYCALGTHPNNASEEQDINLEELIKLAEHPKIVALGETGLDYYYEHSAKHIQQASFIKHIQAAQHLNLPLIIHTRNAEADTQAILEEQLKEKPFSFVLHCYSSNSELADAALNLGGYISFSGLVTFKNAQNIQNIALNVPLERILIETDAPYLAPVPYRGKTNEPSYIIETAKYLAHILKLDLEQFIEITTNNAKRLFQKLA